MMTSLRYREKFSRALYCLAVREGDVRNRLRGAYDQLRVLRADEVPSAIRGEWRCILEDLTKRGPLIYESGVAPKSSINHTLDRMQNRTARKIAERIYRVAIDLQ